MGSGRSLFNLPGHFPIRTLLVKLETVEESPLAQAKRLIFENFTRLRKH